MADVVHINAAGLTHIGMRRDTNQDSYGIAEDMGLFVVADGMGGRQGGGVASTLVVESLKNTLARYLAKDAPAPDPNEPPLTTAADGPEGEGLKLSRYGAILQGGVRLANRAVYDRAVKHRKLKGMGSTVAAVLVHEGIASIANVGDSPIYLMREGDITQLSVTHTVEAEHAQRIASGELDINSPPLDRRYRHVLTRAVGVAPRIKVHMDEFALRHGDALLLCTDGLSNKVDPEELAPYLATHDPKTACEKLVALANERGGEDNICLVILDVAIEPDPHATTTSASTAQTHRPSIFSIMARLLGKG